MSKLIIAIDGPVGAGKSTVARRVAELLGYTYLDSGAMYRALALKALERKVVLDRPDVLEALARETRIEFQPPDPSGAKASAKESAAPVGAEAPTPYHTRVRLDGRDVTEAIRSPEVAQAASRIAVVPGVRRLLVAEQRRAGERGGVVMEGRDIGTVVFPDADLKIYLEASIGVRAERRWRDHHARGEPLDLARMIEEVRERDQRDRERDASPLVRASDAVLVDTTAMEVEETARLVAMLVRQKEGSEGS